MSELAHDQRPGPWTAGASGYAEQFEGFTALYVDEALDRLGVGPGSTVLDIAAGSGVVTAGALARHARVVATDFAEGMAAHIAHSVVGPDGERPAVGVMDGQRLAVVDDVADVTVSMFGVMFVPDTAAGFGEMRRATRPGGRVGVGTFLLEGFPLAAMVVQAVARTLPSYEPRPVVPSWAAVGDDRGLAAALGTAGLVDVAVHPIRRSWRFADPETFFRSAPEWSPPLRGLLDLLGSDDLARAAANFAAVVTERTAAAGGDGVPVDALLGVGTVPA